MQKYACIFYAESRRNKTEGQTCLSVFEREYLRLNVKGTIKRVKMQTFSTRFGIDAEQDNLS